ADKVILPGVGAAGFAMQALKEKGLDEIIPGLMQPLLGVCLGLQLLCSYSEEDDCSCLGVFDVAVKKFPPQDIVPHTGWNNLYDLEGNLFSQVPTNPDVYFVHSYYAALGKETIAKSSYILPFSAGLQKDNFYATQFHPEKSGDTGVQILKNFLAL
ncbi:MAG: imidazole glycerol phosphate synthase subunit HisH, partial [Ferruginibacter sp.]